MAAAPAHELVVAPAPGAPAHDALRAQCYAVRIAVFVDEQKFALADEIDQCVARPPLPPRPPNALAQSR